MQFFAFDFQQFDYDIDMFFFKKIKSYSLTIKHIF